MKLLLFFTKFVQNMIIFKGSNKEECLKEVQPKTNKKQNKTNNKTNKQKSDFDKTCVIL